jgi:hypothetical protein
MMKIYVDGWSWLKLDDLSELDARILRKKLTLVDVAKRTAVTNRIYVEKDGKLGIPRSFFKSSITKTHQVIPLCSNGDPWPERNKAPDGAPWVVHQDGDVDELTLVDAVTGEKSADFFTKDQKSGINMILNSLCDERSGDGIALFASEQAAAKVCLFIIKSFKMRTLVITPPGASLAMWKTVLGRFLPDAKVGLIRRGERDVVDAHVTLTTVDDIHDFQNSGGVKPNEFGFIISHQIHKIDPSAWARAVSFFAPAKRLGIADSAAKFDLGMYRIYKYHLGDPVFCSDPDLETPKIRRVRSSWRISIWAKVNPQFVSKETLLSHMCSSTTFNGHIVEQVKLALEKDRKIMVFSERVPHLKTLKGQIETEWSGPAKTIDYAIDGMPPDEIAKALECDVILTTFSFAKSLPEITKLDTVVLATPVRDPRNYVRLCQVKDPSKKPPVVVDMRCDDIPICLDYGRSRDEVYRSSFGADSA